MSSEYIIHMNEWETNSDVYEGNYIHPTAAIASHVEMGKGNYFGPFCVIGFPAEHKGFWEKPVGKVKIGNNNKFTGLVTIDSGTEKATVIGDNCWFLKHSHVGHDAEIGDDVTISCGAKVGGHAIIHSRSNIGLNACIHQRVRVPEGCMVGMNAAVTKKTELSPFRKYAGVPAKDIGTNLTPDQQGWVDSVKKIEDKLMWGSALEETLLTKIKENPTFQVLGESQGKTIFVLKGIKTSPVMIYIPAEGKIYTSGLGLICNNEDTLIGIFRLLGHNI
jgi:UDP-N-acetylglucosamine acyltransferase